MVNIADENWHLLRAFTAPDAVRVVHVVRQFSPSVGGLEASVFDLARVQRKQFELDAVVVSLNRVFGQSAVLSASDTVAGVPVSRIPWRGSSRYPIAPGVLKHLKGADIVHVHAIDFFFDYLALTAPLHRKSLVASTHGGFFHTQQQAGMKKVWFNTITRASSLAYDRIIACSHGDADTFAHLAESRLALIENGIDQSKFTNAASPVPTRTIISFGRFARHKRIGDLFPILRQLRKLHTGWRLIIAGREYDQSIEQLRDLAAESQVTDIVRFAVDPSNAELRMLIGEASYFGCLSSYEGFGLAAVEAMSAGLFPILSGIAPFQRLHDETNFGIIATIDSPDSVAQAIEGCFLNEAEAYARRRARLSGAVHRYSWDIAAAKYVGLYNEVTSAEVKRADWAFR